MARSRIRRYGLLPAIAAVVVLTGLRPDVHPKQATAAEPAPTGQADHASRLFEVAGGSDEVEADSRSVILAFAGDVHFEGGVAALLDRPGATLGPLSEALRTADVAVVNLESALTSGGSRVRKELEDPSRRYWFRSPPSALDLLERSGVDAVSLANNHGADYGAAGLRDSLRAARISPVGVVGVGRNPEEAFRPYRTSVNGTDVAVLAADASPAESRASIWDVGASGPGVAAARNDARLLAAVRDADRSDAVVVVYLHWGAENVGCPTGGQRTLAQRLADAGADVVVGSHAHLPLGAGMLGNTYVSYGLGNFLWYHGRQAATGVLRVQLVDGKVVRDEWVPGRIRPAGGPPRLVTGAAQIAAVDAWRDLRGCTDLAPGPSTETAVPPPDPAGGDGTDASGSDSGSGLPPYVSSVRPLPTPVRQRMAGRSHDAARCPVGFSDLRLLTLRYVGFDGQPRTGQMIVHAKHARDIVGVFQELYDKRFPIRRMQLVDAYGGNDNRSMAANNTSAYNCRTVAGTSTFSDHAHGGAIDINPVENPYVTAGGVEPAAGRRFVELDRSPGADPPRGVITDGDVVTRAFERIGWEWGGRWSQPDYQHFSAP